MILAHVIASVCRMIDADFVPTDDQPFPPERSGVTTASLSPGKPVRKKARAGGKHNSQTMSANPYADYSSSALSRIAEFFRTYRPIPQDREWAEKKKAQIAAEIERREAEDAEGHK